MYDTSWLITLHAYPGLIPSLSSTPSPSYQVMLENTMAVCNVFVGSVNEGQVTIKIIWSKTIIDQPRSLA